MSNKPDMWDFVTWLDKEARQRREDASYAGYGGDGGYNEIKEQIEIYYDGVSGRFPRVWEKYLKDYTRDNDTEYSKYLELKKKFGDM